MIGLIVAIRFMQDIRCRFGFHGAEPEIFNAFESESLMVVPSSGTACSMCAAAAAKSAMAGRNLRIPGSLLSHDQTEQP